MTTSPARFAAMAFGTVFLLIGILGFIPGITTNYDDLQLAGHEASAELLGIFEVSVLHNAVHILIGLLGLALARTDIGAVRFLIYGGAAYIVLAIYGNVIDLGEDANFLPINDADNWLHLVVGIVMGLLGFALRPKGVRRA